MEEYANDNQEQEVFLPPYCTPHPSPFLSCSLILKLRLRGNSRDPVVQSSINPGLT